MIIDYKLWTTLPLLRLVISSYEYVSYYKYCSIYVGIGYRHMNEIKIVFFSILSPVIIIEIITKVRFKKLKKLSEYFFCFKNSQSRIAL